MTQLFAALLAVAVLVGAAPAAADTATVAVAANFLAPFEALRASFEDASGHRLAAAAGSTGQLYAQIANGAPFDALLAADQEHPERLAAAGLADGTARFTYAVGKLALFTRSRERFAPLGVDTLRRSDFRWLAIANPALAPYGAAAEQTLRALGVWEAVEPRIVRGQNVAQTFAMAETQNADLALVALSQVLTYQGTADYFEIPDHLYAPLRQDAVLLERGHANAAARDFLEFLQSAAAVRLIESFGYGTAGTRSGHSGP
jgi:molybdate transport system substrate-binding protein